ncbi:diacylglycerol kinase family protein [Klugiella xanthotipulae]|uniref:Diacylglycerol kinase family enzyme n=1 Tax=Klugiella xanthotipulae TaxID=244735 RepID=A0A543I6F0_9MICO|nr:diacylglycerol kinase family protein [Klugiella xanthotipulae]TQM66139.1 diacylglycerol kinase family enzyme [Klugiella xanthotipulae]
MGEKSSSQYPRAAVIYHPHKVDVTALREAFTTQQRQSGWAETLWYETTAADAGQTQTRHAIEAGADVVVAVGGDGTVRAVAEALRGTGIPLGLVPQGTGNLLARNIDIPLGDLTDSAARVFTGVNRPLDLGIMTVVRENGDSTEHVFLVLAGVGLDAAAIKATQSKLKKRVGWLAYVDGGIRAIIEQKPLRVKYRFDDRPRGVLSAYSIMIGNCGLMPGGVLLIPEAKPDDGLLDFVALRPQGWFSWLKIWRTIGWENGVLRKTKTGRKIIDLTNDTKSVTYLTGKRFDLSLEQPEEVQLDGDEFGTAVAVHGGVDPGALVVRVSPGSGA